MENFLTDFAKLLENGETVRAEDELDSIVEWDSLTKVSFIVMAERKYGKTLSSKDLQNTQTIFDLYNLLQP